MTKALAQLSNRLLLALVLAAILAPCALAPALAEDGLVPLIAKGEPVDWWFVYKFNSNKFKGQRPFGCCGPDSGTRTCLFDPKNRWRAPGGKMYQGVQTQFGANFSQQYVFASSGTDKLPKGELTKGEKCLGMTLSDPVGATFDEIYHHKPYFLIWNDQFYNDPPIDGCGSGNCNSPWGHSKGVLAWNEQGAGFVMQVTTLSWPGSGTQDHPRVHGNTLGCVSTQNNLKNAQHFFALKLDKQGVIAVLEGLVNAGVATDPHNAQLARIGGPKEIRDLAMSAGVKPKRIRPDKKTAADLKILQIRLTPDVTLISKPSNLNVPPWQMVSALLGSEAERTATRWSPPRIPSTKASTKIGCWEGVLKSENKKSGQVVIAKSGHWGKFPIGLIGGQNHAKIGVATSGSKHYVIFGDLNQQGTLNPVKGRCDKSQNGRGGMFFIVENNEALFKSVSDLLKGEDEPFGKK